jgi:hypothetical protein
MLWSLRAFTAANGEDTEPPLGSQLAVWLARVRSRAAAGDMTEPERAALVAGGVELEELSPVWLTNLEQFNSRTRLHRSTLVGPGNAQTPLRTINASL